MKSICRSLVIATLLYAMGTTAQLQEAVDVIVQAGAEHLPRVWDAAVDVVKKIPVSKREARERWMTDPKTG